MQRLIASKSIQNASLHVPLPTIQHAYAWPFLFLYPTYLYYAIFKRIPTFGSSEAANLVGILLVASQALTYLVTHWSVSAQAKFTSLTTNDVMNAKYVKIIPTKHNGQGAMSKLAKTKDQVPYFYFQKKKFIWDKEKKQFEKLQYVEEKNLGHFQKSIGLDSPSIITSTRDHYGQNSFDIPIPTFQELFKEHMIAPFFVFQLFCVALWFLDDMWYYSLFTLVMLFVFESTVVMQRLQSMKEMRSMSMQPYPIMVYRSGKWTTVQTDDLLPGDLVSITRQKDEGNAIPCDLLLLDGTAIVNEAMLSGESTPLLKESIALRDPNEDLDEKGADKLHILFGGTKILQITPPTSRPQLVAPDGGCLAYVLRTGFGTSQGKLVRTIIYSTERVTANNKEAFIFILFLLVFAIMAASYVWIEGTKNELRKKSKILLDCVLIITSVVPPELPMELSLAVNNSLIALAKLYVFCTEPFRIPFAGKLDVLAFDKTGTLTDTNLVVEGVGGLDDDGSTTLKQPLGTPKDTILTLAAAHALVHVDDGVVGDPMEKRTVDAIEWKVEKNDMVQPKGKGFGKIKILRRFQFSSALKRMSTLCEYQDLNGKRHQFVAVKGAPETLMTMYDNVPKHYETLYKTWAKQGSRVLALGYCKLSQDLSSTEIKDLHRDKVEKNLTFVGFLVFHCPLKNDSVQAIKMLSKSSHRVVMITGDNPLTACHVANAVGIIHKSPLILDEEDGHLVWQDLDNTIEITQATESEVIDPRIYQHHLCVTGRALARLENSPVFDILLPRLWVYARVSPSQKELIITSLNELGYNTLMCGDGTNDVGALKQAHVGVALLDASPEDLQKLAERMRQRRMQEMQKKQKEMIEKWGLKLPDNHPLAQGQQATPDNPMARMMNDMANEAEEVPTIKFGDASVAAPFTSKISSVMSVVNIVRQGRATLVAMLQMYKILALNCIISAYSMSVLYLAGIKQGDWQATIAGLLLTVCFFSIAKSTPLEELSKQRPQSTIFNWYFFLSVLGQCLVHVGALAYVRKEAIIYSEELEEVIDLDAEFKPNLLNTGVYIISLTMQIATFAINYQGRPFRESIYENKALYTGLLWVGIIAVVSAMQIVPWMNNWMQLVPMPKGFQQKLLATMFLDLILAGSIEYVSKTWFADNAPKASLFPDEMKVKKRDSVHVKHKHHRKTSLRGPMHLGEGLEKPLLHDAQHQQLISQ